MRDDHYTQGKVLAVINSDVVKPKTQIVLNDRLAREITIIPRFFEKELFIILQAVCMRLIPQNNNKNKVDLPGLLDDQFVTGTGNGWRYKEMPPDKIAFTAGCKGINETSLIMFNKEFNMLKEADQEEVLSLIQTGNAKGKIWEQMSSALFFEELLASLVELYYSHPYSKDVIGEVSFADAKGWQRLGLDETEMYEPLP